MPATFCADLRALTDVIDEPGLDLVTPAEALIDLWREVVPSFLGLTIIFSSTGPDLVIRTLDEHLPAPAVGSSIQMPSRAPAHSGARVLIVCYTAAPGAFVDFTADAAHILGLHLDNILLDQDLSPAVRTEPADASLINIAVGVLIERGHHPDRAGAELRRIASRNEVTLAVAAQQILDSITPRSI